MIVHSLKVIRLQGLHQSLFNGMSFSEKNLSQKGGWGKIMFLAKFENGLSSHCYLLRTIFGMYTTI